MKYAFTLPTVVRQLSGKLSELIVKGASRPGQTSRNDCEVRFDTTQEFRWMEAAK